MLDLGAALVGAAELRDGAADDRPAVVVAVERVPDERADDHARLDAVAALADLADELGAAAGDDADREVVGPQLVEQLEHRLVDDALERRRRGVRWR